MTKKPSKSMIELTSFQRGFTFGEVYYNANPTLDTLNLLRVATSLRVPSVYNREKYMLGFTQCYDEMKNNHSQTVNQLTIQEKENTVMTTPTTKTTKNTKPTLAELQAKAKQAAAATSNQSDAERQAYVNSCMFSGRLGKDVEMSYTNSGKAIYKTSLAVYMGGKGENKITLWLNLVLWGQEEDTDKYQNNNALCEKFLALEKGAEVVVEGRFTKDEYTDREGNKRESYGLTLSNIE